MEHKFNISLCDPKSSSSDSPGSSDSDTVHHDELKIKIPRKPSPTADSPPTPEDIATYREENEKVIINIGGAKFEVK